MPLLLACSNSNNLLLGRVEATLGKHTVVVTDCYRTSVPQPQEVKGAAGTTVEYHWTPCRDADIVVHDEALTVNGASYGRLNSRDYITVDHGTILINDQKARVIAE